jgi:hypothetical protein
MKIRSLFVVIAAILLLVVWGSAVSAQGSDNPPDDLANFLRFKPVDAAAYAHAKTLADAEVSLQTGVPLQVASASPAAFLSWEGQNMLSPLINLSPSDSTGAIGLTEYTELVNQRIGVYARTSALLSSNTLNGFTGLSSANKLFDVQIIWDPGQQRFFFAMDDVQNKTNNLLAFGFSKGPSPSASPGDWCRYQSAFKTYGLTFPDYPKLGDTADFILIGVNRFNSTGTSYLGSDLAWVGKPPLGVVTTCPALSSFKLGTFKRLKNANGTLAFTPVPANQTDTSGTGYVVASRNVGGGGSGTFLSVFKVTKNPVTGGAQVGSAQTITVPSYSLPPDAPQAGSADRLDTLDGRLTQGVSAIDPAHGRVAIWTQHTVKASAGGLGSEVRWYEIDPTTNSLFQSGIAHSPGLFVFNGAASPDRLVNGATMAFGSNMVLGFNTSSSSNHETIQMLSKIGANPQSGFVLVHQSPGKIEDFTCKPSCRWGDYAGASPDPGASPTGVTGLVWLTSMFNHASADPQNIDWSTWNWGVNP